MACPCPRLRVRHFLLLILTSLLYLGALFLTASTGERRRLGAARFDESELLAFVGSDADAEQEKKLIKDLLQHADPEPCRGRAATRNPPQPDPHFYSLMQARLASLHRPFDAKVMQTLATTIKTPLAKQPRRYTSCAVVGNSGTLLNATHGAAIDAHEAVVRLNNARTAGFELHVGRRTTIAFMNSNVLHRCARRLGCYCEVYGVPVPIVVYVSQMQHLMDVARCKRAQTPLIVTDPRFDALTARIAKWYSVREGGGVREWERKEQEFHYSSGLQAVLLALGICEEVDLFGFGKANKTKHHYHTAQAEELHLHDYAAEYVFYNELVRRDDVPLLRDAGIRLPRVRVFGHEP